jgi:hypothetical protein
MAYLYPDQLESLERLVDKHTLQGVLEGLAFIAGEKASHVAENWQDTNLAKSWERDADYLDRMAPGVEN